MLLSRIFEVFIFFLKKDLVDKKTYQKFAPAKRKRAHNSVGSEWLPYKQQVGGSSPSVPTRPSRDGRPFLFLYVPILYRESRRFVPSSRDCAHNISHPEFGGGSCFVYGFVPQTSAEVLYTI